MAGLYERHDRERFEVIALDNGSADASVSGIIGAPLPQHDANNGFCF